jgi:putative OPT family oligopeptide transporter
VPLLVFFLGPNLQNFLPAGVGVEAGWHDQAKAVWFYIVRPIAVGGMLVGAAYTLYKMRKNLFGGLGKAFRELKGGAPAPDTLTRTQRYMSSKTVFSLIGVMFVLMVALYIYLSKLVLGGFVAAVVMIIAAFFFATVSGYLVGMIGSTNNPISGLTLSTLIIAALLMITLGVSGSSGVVAVLGVAAVVCVSSAVAGELLQDFKVGYILGGTPRTIQIVELLAVTCASLVMFFPIMMLYYGNLKAHGIGFGDPKLAAPQAGLMASLAQGIVSHEMAWPLVVVGILMGIVMIMLEVRSPMLVAVGMYLPLDTTFAIFVGGVIRWVTDTIAQRKGYNTAQKIRVENVGILIASGLIAGEALMGLCTATYKYYADKGELPSLLANPSYAVGLIVLAVMAWTMVSVPLKNAGSPDEPAPPAAMM